MSEEGDSTRTCTTEGGYDGEPRRCERDPSQVSGICSSTGDPHFRSLDGSTFNFQGRGYYHLLNHPNLVVQVRQVQWGRRASVNSWVALSGSHAGGRTVEIYGQGRGLFVRLDGARVPLRDNVVSGPVSFSWSNARQITVQLTNGVQLQVHAWRRFLNLYLTIPGTYRETTGGLCGNFNSDGDDDGGGEPPIPPCETLFTARTEQPDCNLSHSSTDATTVQPTTMDTDATIDTGGDPGGGNPAADTTTPNIDVTINTGGDPGGGGRASTTTPDPLDEEAWSLLLANTRTEVATGSEEPILDSAARPYNIDADCSARVRDSAERACARVQGRARADCIEDVCLTLDDGNVTIGSLTSNAADIAAGTVEVADTVANITVDAAAASAIVCPFVELLHGSTSGACVGHAGDTCNYAECNDGYILSNGSQDRTCEAESHGWTGTAKQCLKSPHARMTNHSSNEIQVLPGARFDIDIQVYSPRGESDTEVLVELPLWLVPLQSQIVFASAFLNFSVTDSVLPFVLERNSQKQNVRVQLGYLFNSAGEDAGISAPNVSIATDGIIVRITLEVDREASATRTAVPLPFAVHTLETHVGSGLDSVVPTVSVVQPQLQFRPTLSLDQVHGGQIVNLSLTIANTGSFRSGAVMGQCNSTNTFQILNLNGSMYDMDPFIAIFEIDGLRPSEEITLYWPGQMIESLAVGAVLLFQCDALYRADDMQYGDLRNYTASSTGEVTVVPAQISFPENNPSHTSVDETSIIDEIVSIQLPPGTHAQRAALQVELHGGAFLNLRQVVRKVGSTDEPNVDGATSRRSANEDGMHSARRRIASIDLGDISSDESISNQATTLQFQIIIDVFADDIIDEAWYEVTFETPASEVALNSTIYQFQIETESASTRSSNTGVAAASVALVIVAIVAMVVVVLAVHRRNQGIRTSALPLSTIENKSNNFTLTQNPCSGTRAPQLMSLAGVTTDSSTTTTLGSSSPSFEVCPCDGSLRLKSVLRKNPLTASSNDYLEPTSGMPAKDYQVPVSQDGTGYGECIDASLPYDVYATCRGCSIYDNGSVDVPLRSSTSIYGRPTSDYAVYPKAGLTEGATCSEPVTRIAESSDVYDNHNRSQCGDDGGHIYGQYSGSQPACSQIEISNSKTLYSVANFESDDPVYRRAVSVVYGLETEDRAGEVYANSTADVYGLHGDPNMTAEQTFADYGRHP